MIAIELGVMALKIVVETLVLVIEGVISAILIFHSLKFLETWYKGYTKQKEDMIRTEALKYSALPVLKQIN